MKASLQYVDIFLVHSIKILSFNCLIFVQEDYEIWGPKFPKDYEEIIKLSKSSELYSTAKKKDLYNMFSKGILLQDDKVWFSLGGNGERNEMISARKFSYINHSPHNWISVPESRFVSSLSLTNTFYVCLCCSLPSQDYHSVTCFLTC
ncbi:hypothetical protein HanHA89_Chr11g0417101 [Helianthus annuus]|nr:hypothetical protein HanHA89_Chr11g0417101 [Helianthus annuus]